MRYLIPTVLDPTTNVASQPKAIATLNAVAIRRRRSLCGVADLRAPNCRLYVCLITGKEALGIDASIARWIPVSGICDNTGAEHDDGADDGKAKATSEHGYT